MTDYTADVTVVGAGPGGSVAALELARAGLNVVVIERAKTLERSFRGESLSPDAVAVLDNVGALAGIRERGALITRRLEISERRKRLMQAEFKDFDFHQRFPYEVPQPTLLATLQALAEEESSYHMLRGATVQQLIYEQGRVAGVQFSDSSGEHTVRSPLVVAADGRYSALLKLSDLQSERIPLDRDVVWMRTPLPPEWDTETYRIRMQGALHGLFIPTYPDMVRIGFNIPKGGLRDLRSGGIDKLHATITELAPEVSGLVRKHVRKFSDTSTLDIFTSRTPQWSRPGLVLIGDAAHTLSPILGQGVNHALIDGVVLARLLTDAIQTRAGAALNTRVDAATAEFQARREPDVTASRQLQLRQERLFTFGGPIGITARSTLYRSMSASETVRSRVLENAYFRLQPKGGRALVL